VRPRRRMNVVIMLATAAVVLVVVRLDVAHREMPQRVDSIRGTDGLNGAVGVYGPTGEVSGRELRFVWRPIAGAVSYRLVLSDASSRPIWSATGPDTAVALPASIPIRSGESYFWIVDGLASNGITRSTGVREFRARD
jgi:hypothetical protein